MCGIIAISGDNTKKIQDAHINKMLASLSRRGPDDMGFLRFDNCILGQTRLSIIDISGGHQPMKDNEGNLTITFNGEIYNYRELKGDLLKKGYVFSTNSDTEVIMKAYIEYKNNCVEYLDGMFSFAIWDEKNQELFIARDRFGKKPLYYTFIDEIFFSASEIKALLASGLIEGKISHEALDNYLKLGYIPPWQTIYSNIHTLPPAHIGIIKNGKINTFRYWSLKKRTLDISYESAKAKIKELFDESVKKRMVADVEIGSFLSGGVDSTLVTAYAQKYSATAIKTFAVGYGDHINELPYAKQASEKIGTNHYTLQVKSDLIDELEKVISYMDEPHADSSDFPQHLVSELAGTKVKVALSGDGADELFMGYGWYWKYFNLPKWKRVLNAFTTNIFKEHIKLITIFSEKDRKSLWKIKVLNNNIQTENLVKLGNSIDKINLFDLTTYLPGQLLTKIDRTSMMHSLEVRSPFLDYRLAEFVYNLPEKFKTDRRNGKIILKDILSEIMPEKFVYRRKQGFGAPVKEWLKTETMRMFVEKTLNESTSLNEIFNKKKINDLINDFYNRNNLSVQYKIWSLLCLALWFKYHK